MHYKNGREARNGDPVVAKGYNNGIVAGTLHSTNAGCTTCNGQVAVPIAGGCANHCVTIGEIYHSEDAFNEIESFISRVAAEKAAAEKAAAT